VGKVYLVKKLQGKERPKFSKRGKERFAFQGTPHTFVCTCGEEFSSLNPREANAKYEEHKKTCTEVS